MFDSAHHLILLLWDDQDPGNTLKIAHIYTANEEKLDQTVIFQAFNITANSGGFSAQPTSFAVDFHGKNNFSNNDISISDSSPRRVVNLGSFPFACEWVDSGGQRRTQANITGGNTKHPGPA